jgi:hypothetical protein
MHALASGFVGAAALTAIHETARQMIDAPPRMDVVGMRGLERLYRFAGAEPPGTDVLYRQTMAGDLMSNGVYYAAIPGGSARAVWTKAVALGLAAGVGAILLPRPLGLGEPPNNERTRTRVLTVAWYLAGALVTAAVANGGRRLSEA